MNTCNLRAAFPTSWFELNLLGQALEPTQEILNQSTSGDIKPDTLAPRDDNTDDTVFEVDPITCLRLYKALINAHTYVAQVLALTDSGPDDSAP